MTDNDTRDAGAILACITKAEGAFNDWNATCADIDAIYSLGEGSGNYLLEHHGWTDTKLDMFWASFEVLKPAIYARPPQPVVAPLFKDNKRLQNTTAELLERCAISAFKRTDINSVMLQARDDLLFAGRGALWLSYESGDDGQCVHIEHKDRLDFLHEPARYWSEVGWVAGAAWLTREQMEKRFNKEIAEEAAYTTRREDEADAEAKRAVAPKCKVWEVWHKADKKVYWVSEGVDRFLDEDDPHLTLTDFFPCPKPAYATLRRRTLIPTPDWQRYAVHFRKISDLTGRIYLLLDSVRMKGLIPAGGDIGDAVEQLMTSDDDQMLVPVPGAAMLNQGANGFVSWLPLTELAAAIQGLIEARSQLISDFYELSGISDIMRGATDADETLGAQQLKSQYGSVRVREKSAELQRCAADAVKIAAEIIADKFTSETLLDMAQMEIPTKAAIKKRIKEIEDAAEDELKAVQKQAQEAAQQGQEQIDPQQAAQAFQQAQQGVLAKYAPMLAEAEGQVALEDVMKLLRDDRTRSFTFEIESSSTILTDELQEKASRNEFIQAFTSASQALMGMVAMGDAGAKLAGELMRFTLAPYRAGRSLDGAIEAFIDAAPEMAAKAQGNDENEALAEANNKLAEAEQVKAQAAMAGVQAKAALDQAENQRKFAELQLKAQNEAANHERENEKLRLQVAQAETTAMQAGEKMAAEIDKLRADTYAILVKAGVAQDQQALDEFKTVADVNARTVDQSMSAERNERADMESDRSAAMGERQQEFSERQAMNEGGD